MTPTGSFLYLPFDIPDARKMCRQIGIKPLSTDKGHYSLSIPIYSMKGPEEILKNLSWKFELIFPRMNVTLLPFWVIEYYFKRNCHLCCPLEALK